MPRNLVRFAPLVLTGCTLLSGAASLSVGSEAGSSDVAARVNADGDTGGGSRLDASTAKDAYAKTKVPEDASDAVEPPMDAAVDSGAGTEASAPVTTTFPVTLAEDAQQAFGPFKAPAGTSFEARMTGSGDPDLFLRFGSPPTVRPTAYDCLSDGPAAEERCRRRVPGGGESVYLLVYAYAACDATLTVTYTPAP